MASEQGLLEQISVEEHSRFVKATFERSLYPLDSIYGAAYTFIDRCYVFLDAPDERHVSVELRGREPLDEAGLRALAGEFANELLTQAWRYEITERNRLAIETVTMQALAGAAGFERSDDLGELSDLELSDDVFDDPLGIATPWEEKYGTKDAAAPGVRAPAPVEPINADAFDDPLGITKPWSPDAASSAASGEKPKG